MVRREDARYWLPFGLVAGLGFLNKYSMAFFGIALAVGLLLTAQRRLLFTRWMPAGALLALFVALPNLLWQIEVSIREFWPKVKCWTCERPDFMRAPRGPGMRSADTSP